MHKEFAAGIEKLRSEFDLRISALVQRPKSWSAVSAVIVDLPALWGSRRA